MAMHIPGHVMAFAAPHVPSKMRATMSRAMAPPLVVTVIMAVSLLQAASGWLCGGRAFDRDGFLALYSQTLEHCDILPDTVAGAVDGIQGMCLQPATKGMVGKRRCSSRFIRATS